MENVIQKPVENKTERQFDLFFSFEHEIEKKVKRLNDAMKKYLEINICQVNINANKKSQEKKIEEEIIDSKIFICCLTKAYTLSKQCQSEIAFAYMKDKPMIVLMFEKLTNQDLCSIAYGLSNISKINLYEDTRFDSWDGSLFIHVVKSVELLLKRKIRKALIENEKRKGSISMKPPSLSIISSTSYDIDIKMVTLEKSKLEDQNSLPTLPTATIVSFEAMEYGTLQKEVVQKDELYPREMVNLVKVKSNSFLGTSKSYGYNRVVYLPSKQRYLLTSSLNKTIISLDNDGNWIEKRNPEGKLQQPFAICLTRSEEILVGDNVSKCIFVFDSNLKYLKTIAEKALVGFTDMDVDPMNNDLYAVSLYDSLIVIVDIETGKLKRKIFISTPAYIRVTSTQLFIISAADLIYAINKFDLQANYTIRIENNKFVNGLFTDKYENVYTTAHADSSTLEDSNDTETSKEVYLCYISFQDGINVKRINLGLTQVNDFIIFENKHLTCINDTHVDMFNFDGFNNFSTSHSSSKDFESNQSTKNSVIGSGALLKKESHMPETTKIEQTSF